MRNSLENLSLLSFGSKEDEWHEAGGIIRAIYTIAKFIEENDIFNISVMDKSMVAALGYYLGYPQLMYIDDNSQISAVSKISTNDFKTLCRFNIAKLFKTSIDNLIGKLKKHNRDSAADREKYSNFFPENLLISPELDKRLESYVDDFNLIEYDLKNLIEHRNSKNKIDSSGYFRYFYSKFLYRCEPTKYIFNSDAESFDHYLKVVRCLCLSYILATQYGGDSEYADAPVYRGDYCVGTMKIQVDSTGYDRSSKIFNQLNNGGYFSPLVLFVCYNKINVIPSILNGCVSEQIKLSSKKSEQELLYSMVYLDQCLAY